MSHTISKKEKNLHYILNKQDHCAAILEAVCGDPDRTSLRKLMNLLLEGLWMSALDHENPTKSGNWLTLNNTDSGS